MRSTEKSTQAFRENTEVFGINFHDFIVKEDQTTSYELASEFGITLGDVQKLKKHLRRG